MCLEHLNLIKDKKNQNNNIHMNGFALYIHTHIFTYINVAQLCNEPLLQNIDLVSTIIHYKMFAPPCLI